ncbi:MAG: YggS family pyridoxal phosphate-dependent enzyme [Gammaproteobacteria bacterium]|nr:YggS family pyridoxal phosphate-dependent enzyme [Gammaproteobacteria bacterium]
MNELAANLTRIRETIAAAARAAGRQPGEIKLIAVSKTHPAEIVEAALQLGQRVFGENTVQEALTKISRIRNVELEWHFIGYLQSNKAKFIPDNFSWFHSLDSVKLGQRLSRLAEEKKVVVNTLIEVNVTGDPNKHGVAPTQLTPLLDTLLQTPLPGVALRGLMTIGAHGVVTDRTRAPFAQLRELLNESATRFSLPQFDQLSMGMSGDYLEAIREGSTMVRIGTAIFGERDYDNAAD